MLVGGKPPSIEAISPTVVVGISKKYTKPKITNIALSAEGMIFVIFSSQMMSIAIRTSLRMNKAVCLASKGH